MKEKKRCVSFSSMLPLSTAGSLAWASVGRHTCASWSVGVSGLQAEGQAGALASGEPQLGWLLMPSSPLRIET